MICWPDSNTSVVHQWSPAHRLGTSGLCCKNIKHKLSEKLSEREKHSMCVVRHTCTSLAQVGFTPACNTNTLHFGFYCYNCHNLWTCIRKKVQHQPEVQLHIWLVLHFQPSFLLQKDDSKHTRVLMRCSRCQQNIVMKRQNKTIAAARTKHGVWLQEFLFPASVCLSLLYFTVKLADDFVYSSISTQSRGANYPRALLCLPPLRKLIRGYPCKNKVSSLQSRQVKQPRRLSREEKLSKKNRTLTTTNWWVTSNKWIWVCICVNSHLHRHSTEL